MYDRQSKSARLVVTLASVVSRFTMIREFISSAFDRSFCFFGVLLNSADQLIFFAFQKPKIVIGKLRQLLFQFAFGDVPVSFCGQCLHQLIVLICSWPASQKPCRSK